MKAAAAIAQQTAAISKEETEAAHEKQVAALKLANDLLQQQLAEMVQSVPAMLTSHMFYIPLHTSLFVISPACMTETDTVSTTVDKRA